MNLTLAEQQHLSIDICSMIEDELAWLCNFQPSSKRVSDLSTDDILLTGKIVCLVLLSVITLKHMEGFMVSQLIKTQESFHGVALLLSKCHVHSNK